MALTTCKWQSEPGPQVVDEEHVVNIIVHCVYDLPHKSVYKSLAHLHVVITTLGTRCTLEVESATETCACAVDGGLQERIRTGD